MVIGEAPGADEDRQGEPFVGRAGQLLERDAARDRARARAGVTLRTFSSVGRPNNRDPQPEEARPARRT